MGYYVSFATTKNPEPMDGDEVASVAGWAAFGDWATGLGRAYPELSYLGWHGECHPAECVEGLAKEIQRARAEKPGSPSENVLHVLQRLAEIVKQRPPSCVGFVVTDGTEGTDESDEGD